MPKCPKCKKEIECLDNYQSGENHYRVWLNGEDTDYDLKEFQEDNQVNDYECPECGEVLFTDEDKAVKFLKNKDELTELVKEKMEKIKNEME